MLSGFLFCAGNWSDAGIGGYRHYWRQSKPLVGYSLTFSAGIGNQPGVALVPEPAGWSLIIAGLALAGAAMRRRAGCAT